MFLVSTVTTWNGNTGTVYVDEPVSDTFSKSGIHNIIEPAAASNPVIFGSNFLNSNKFFQKLIQNILISNKNFQKSIHKILIFNKNFQKMIFHILYIYLMVFDPLYILYILFFLHQIY